MAGNQRHNGRISSCKTWNDSLRFYFASLGPILHSLITNNMQNILPG